MYAEIHEHFTDSYVCRRLVYTLTAGQCEWLGQEALQSR